MKHCTKCNTWKIPEDFGTNKTRVDGLQSYCKNCRKLYQKEWYSENRDLQKKRARKSNIRRCTELKKLMYKFYYENPCVDCGESDPVVLECDHLVDKKHNVSDMVRVGMKWESIQLEISKCVVRCANCHRRKTAKESKWFKFVDHHKGE